MPKIRKTVSCNADCAQLCLTKSLLLPPGGGGGGGVVVVSGGGGGGVVTPPSVLGHSLDPVVEAIQFLAAEITQLA